MYDIPADKFIKTKSIEVHHNSEIILMEKEFVELTDYDQADIRCGPDTLRNEDFLKIYQLPKR